MHLATSNLTTSTDSICQLLRTAVTTDTHILVCGDFNYRNIDWSDYPIVLNGCSRSQSFLDTTMDLYLFQHVTEPTRFREGCSPHTLDLIFTNEDDMASVCSIFPVWVAVTMFVYNLLYLATPLTSQNPPIIDTTFDMLIMLP